LPANKVSDGATNKNAATEASATITVDTTAPTCSISGNPSSWQNTNATLTLSMSDTNVNSNGYKWDSGSYGSTKTTTVSANGVHT
jgi:hypothetical protein